MSVYSRLSSTVRTVTSSKPALWSTSCSAPSAASLNIPGPVGSGGSACPRATIVCEVIVAHGLRSGLSQTANAALPPGRRTRLISCAAASGSTTSMIPQRHSTASTAAVGRSIHSSSSCANSTLSVPVCAARARATPSIASAPSLEIRVPPGRISSAAMKPVSPGPAASSSTRWPGCSASPSIIATETGIPHARTRSARLPHPWAADSHIWRLAARCSSGSTALTVGTLLDRGPPKLRERRVDLGAHPLPEDRQQRLRRERPQIVDRRLDLGPATDRHAGVQERLPDLVDEQVDKRRGDRVAVALDLLELRQRAVERHPAGYHALGHREQRRARNLEVAVVHGDNHPEPLRAPEHPRRVLGADPEAAPELGNGQRLRLLRIRRLGQRLSDARQALRHPLAVVEQVLDRREVESLLLEVADQLEPRNVLGVVVPDPQTHLGAGQQSPRLVRADVSH